MSRSGRVSRKVRLSWRGGTFGPEGATPEELEPEKSFFQSRKRMSREKTRPTTRVSRNQTQVIRAAAIGRYRPPYENCTTRLPAPLHPSHRVARETDALLPRFRLRCARWTSIIYHRSRSLSAKHRRPRNGQIGSARGKSEMDGQLARQASIRTVLGITIVIHWRAAKRTLQYLRRTEDLGIIYG